MQAQESLNVAIHLLGRFAVERRGEEIPNSAWKKRRPVELLASLALAPGRALHREELIDRLWPDKDLESGANNLYRALHDLRRIVGEQIAVIERGAVRLVDGIIVDVDVFERAVIKADRASLEQAVELYRGELLPDDPYSDALAARRESLRQRFVDGALKLARLLERPDELEQRTSVLRKLLDVEPAVEEAHRMLMSALARAGRESDALTQFSRCVQVLRERLDREPAPETLQLKRQIAAGDLRPAPSSPHGCDARHVAQRLLGTSSPPRLHGRTGTLEAVDRFIREGRGVRLVIGEAGIGKSRIAVEGAFRASDAGAAVFAGIGYDFAGTAPYTPFVDAWTDALRLAGDIAEPNPFLSFRPTPGASAQEDRLRLFQAVEGSLAAIARGTGIYFIVEDAHLADESSLQLLHYLARATRHMPLMLVVTLREEEVRAGTALHTLISGLRRERLAERIHLERLDRSSTSELVSDLLGHDCDAATLDAIYEMAEGNPFYTEELVRTLGDRSAAELRRGELPSDLLETVRQRVARLGRDAERLLATASVMGLHFDFETVHRAVDIDAAVALDALERGLEARVIEEDGRGYRFRHALTRQALYGGLTHARRVYLHRAVATALEAEPNKKREQLSEMLAFHHQAAGQIDRALVHLIEAADRAKARLGFGEAVAFSEQALEIMEALGIGAGPERFALLSSIGGMRVALGELDAAVRDLDRAAALSRSEDGWRPTPDDRARALRFAALALIEGGELAAAEARIKDALGELEKTGDSAEISNVLYLYSQLRWHQSRHREAYELAERCLAAAERRGDSDAIAKGFEMLALACHSLGEWRQGREFEEKRQQHASGTLDVASAFDVHL